MEILSKYKENTLRFFIILLSLYALIIAGIPIFNSIFTKRLTYDDCSKIEKIDNSGNKVVEIVKINPKGIAEKSGLKQGDVIIAVNGIPVNSLNEFLDEIVKSDGKSPALYTIERNGEIKSIIVPVYKYFHLIFYIFAFLGLGFLMNGFFVGISKPKELTSLIFFLFSFFSSFGFMTYGGVWYYVGYSGTLMMHYYIANIFIYPLLFHFFTIYPVYLKLKRRKLLIMLVYCFSVLLGFPGIFESVVDTINIYPVLALSLSYSPFLIVIISILVFINSYRRIKSPELKEPLRVLLLGLIIGFAGFAYYYFGFTLFVMNFGMNPLYRLPVILVLAIPTTFGYSIYKYRILDTEFFVKRGIVFTLASFVTISAYLFALNMLNTLFEFYSFKNRQLITIITVILVIFSFSYVTKLIKSFVDKRFYKTRYNYRKSLLKFSDELPYLNSIKEVSLKLSSVLNETMGVNNVQIWDIQYKTDITCEEECSLKSDICSFLYKEDRNPKLLFKLNMLENNYPAEYIEYITLKGFVLSLPVFVRNEFVAAVNLGEKPESSPYSDEDIDLLKTICSSISVVFENSRLRLEEIRKNKLEEELNVAKRIQESLLPDRNFSHDNIEISCTSNPARIVGGDFFDIIKIDDNNILIVIADVSGKGLPAALYMAKVQALIRFASKVFTSPKDIISEVNKQIYGKFERNSFVTVSLGLINTSTRRMKFVRAGHNPAIFAGNGSVKFLNTRGIGLGLDKDRIFRDNLDEHEIHINKDNLILFYTDGLNEAMNKNKDEFGTGRIVDILKSSKHLSTNEINDLLINNVKEFSGNSEQHDDITFVIVKSYI